MDAETKGLVERRRALLALPPAERIEAILAAPRPAELVRLLPAQEFYLTLQDAGLDEALPLLPLAAPAQRDFLFDIDAWQRDRFDPSRAGDWLLAFREADPELLARWLREGDEPLVVLALSRLLRIYKADESTDQAFWPPDRPVPTYDGVYFGEPRDDDTEDAAGALWEALGVLQRRHRPAYEALLEQVLWAIPAEAEEQCYGDRLSRLAERGFPELDEALEVWAGTGVGEGAARAIVARVAASAGDPPVAAGAAAAHGTDEGGPAGDASPHALALLAPDDEPAPPTALAEAARHLDAAAREQLRGDLVRLANRYAVAALGDLGEPATHRTALRTALSHVNLGLLIACDGAVADRGAAALRQVPVFTLNDLAVGAIQSRIVRARRIEKGWLARLPYARARLDQELDEALQGLLELRPRFTANDEARPFREFEDLGVLDHVLRILESLGAFLEALGTVELPHGEGREVRGLERVPHGRGSRRDLEWSAVAATAVARTLLGEGAASCRPLDLAAAARALGLALGGPLPRIVTPAFGDACTALGLDGAADFLGVRLEDDAGELRHGDVPDPRFVRALLFAPS